MSAQSAPQGPHRGAEFVPYDWMPKNDADKHWDCLPAAAFGAHFVGDRVFILASGTPSGCRRWEGRWPYPVGAHPWGRDELEGLVRLAVESGVPAGSLGRVSDGVPRRVDRLRCLGNAVLPQQAEYLGRLLSAQFDGQEVRPA